MMQRVIVNRSILLKAASQLSYVPTKSVHTPMIKFLGKRDLVKAGAQAAAASSSTAQVGSAPSSNKPLSPNCSVSFDSSHGAHARRLVISQEECDIINAGGEEVPDWTKITL